MDLEIATTIVIRLFLVVTMAAIGLQLGRTASRAMLPGPLLAGRVLLVNLLAVPALALAVCLLADLDGAVAFGILVVAAAPAGSIAPKLVEIARGDLAVGVIATFGLGAFAILTVPPTVLLLTELAGLPAAAVSIDGVGVVGSLAVFQLAPMVAGLVGARTRPTAAARAAGPLRRASTILLVLLVAIVVADTLRELLTIDLRAVAAMVVITAGALAAGWLAGGREGRAQRAGALVTAQRSGGIALLIATELGDPTAIGTVVAFVLVTFVMNLAVAGGLARVAAVRATGQPAVA